MGDAEAVTGGSVGEVAVQLVARGETYGVNDHVQAVPLLAQLFEDLGDFFVAGHVAREAQFRARAPACGELFDTALELFVLVGEGKFCALAMHGGSDAGCDGQFTGDTDDQYALTGEKTHVLFLFRLIDSGWSQECGFQQLLCIWMLWAGEDSARRALFNDLPLLDHHQLVAERLDHRQIMADEQVGQVVFFLQ
ncbi:hypothetical protein D9M71_528990 [compost metagenome]